VLEVILFTESNNSNVIYMTSQNIGAAHAFTTRFGGKSSGIFESLNLGFRTGDDIANVRKNYDLICNTLGIAVDSIVCSNQVHGTFIRVATRDDRGGLFTPTAHQADGLLTNEPGVALMVFTADCVPILLYDPVKRVIGAVHAGWRGTAADIAGAAISKMTNEFDCSPADISAAIGPCISKCCYETDPDVAEALRGISVEIADKCVTGRGSKYMVDLKDANRLLLEQAGVCDIAVSDECTACRSDKYWSHRQTKGQRGSQGAIISIN
jgi:hypothetical protein